MFGSEDPDAARDESPYVGRRKQLEEVRAELTSGTSGVQLVLVRGPPAVGKKAFLEQVVKQLSEEASYRQAPDGATWNVCSYTVNCPMMASLDDVTSCLLGNDDFPLDSGFGSMRPNTEHDVISHFRSRLEASDTTVHLWVLQDLDRMAGNWRQQHQQHQQQQQHHQHQHQHQYQQHQQTQQEMLLPLMQRFLGLSRARCFVLASSFRQLDFPGVRAHEVWLQRLQVSEVTDLLRLTVPDVCLRDRHVEVICEWCHGRPGEVLRQGARLRKRGAGPRLTPDELCQLLRGSERREGCWEAEALLPEVDPATRRFLSQLRIFKGSFRLEDAAAVTVTEEERRAEVKKHLLQLLRGGLLEVEPGERMRVLPELLASSGGGEGEVTSAHVKHDDAVRLRFVTYFGRVLVHAERELYVRPLEAVYGYLHGDWPHLKQLLLEAVHCSSNTFPAFFQVACVADNFLVKCFPEEAVSFYQSLQAAAALFGSRQQQAVCQGLLGMALTRGHARVPGADNEAAQGLMRQARQTLVEEGSPPRLLLDLQDQLGFNLYRQGKYTKAYRVHFEALEMAGQTEADEKLINRIVSIRSNMAISMIFLGRFEEAEALLKETMRLAEQVAPHHPALPIMLNSLGLIYERSGWSDSQALQYYHASLKQRRQYRGAARLDLVVVLNNVAMQHSKRGFHGLGLELLEEALEIRREHEWQDYQTALTLWNTGQVHRRRQDFQKALELMEEASNIFAKCSKKHFVNCEVHLDMAHCCCLLRQTEEAVRHLREVLGMRACCLKHVPQGRFPLQALEHLVLLFGQGGDYFRLLEEELRRLAGESEEAEARAAILARLQRWQQLLPALSHSTRSTSSLSTHSTLTHSTLTHSTLTHSSVFPHHLSIPSYRGNAPSQHSSLPHQRAGPGHASSSRLVTSDVSSRQDDVRVSGENAEDDVGCHVGDVTPSAGNVTRSAAAGGVGAGNDVSLSEENVTSSAAPEPLVPASSASSSASSSSASSSWPGGEGGGGVAGGAGEEALLELVCGQCHVCGDCLRWGLGCRAAWLQARARQRQLDALRDLGADTSRLPPHIADPALDPPPSPLHSHSPPGPPLADPPQVDRGALLKSLLRMPPPPPGRGGSGPQPPGKAPPGCRGEGDVTPPRPQQPLSSCSSGRGGTGGGSSGFCEATGSFGKSAVPPGGPGEGGGQQQGEGGQGRGKLSTQGGGDALPPSPGIPSPLVVPDSPQLFGPPQRLPRCLARGAGPPGLEGVSWAGQGAWPPLSRQRGGGREPVEHEEPPSLSLSSLDLSPPLLAPPNLPLPRRAEENDERMRGNDVTCSVEGCCCSIRNSSCPYHDVID